MRTIRTTALALLLVWTTVVCAQYPVSLQPAVTKQDTLPADSLPADTIRDVATPSPDQEVSELKKQALTWVRRLIYRGFLDDQVTGTSATYALTEWSEASGPYGQVLAHVSVVYLGSISWLGKPSTWFQATYRSLDLDRPSIDFDLVLAGRDRLGDAYRALWRVNKEELSALNFGAPSGTFDYDRDDEPRAGEQMTLELYTGNFPVTLYRGSGADGAKVIAYRAKDVPPLSLVRLSYGSMSLNLRDRASDVEPKLKVPLPTSR